PEAESLYRAAGIDPAAAFSDSGLVGFDLIDHQAIFAEHVSRSSEFWIEVHKLFDARHFVFRGKSNRAGDYGEVRDGVLKDVGRFTPLAEGEIPQSSGFCTGNGVFE